MLVIFVLVLVLFGGKRMPELAKNLGKSLRDFKKAREGVEDQIKRALDESPAPAKRVKKLRKPKPEGATTTPDDTTVYDEAAKAAGATATTAAIAADATDAPESPDAVSPDGTAGHDSPGTEINEPENNYEIDPYADEYIGGTMESDAAAHGREDENPGENPDENPDETPGENPDESGEIKPASGETDSGAIDSSEAGSGEGEPDKKKSAPDSGMHDGGGI